MSQTAIPENLKARLLKMIALAQDPGANEHEAAMASAKVQAMLAEYNLELSSIVDVEDGEANPDAAREKVDLELVTKTEWQNDLLAAIAANNFCLHIASTTWDTEKREYTSERRHSIVGRAVNTATTRQIYAYLTATVLRLNPYTGRQIKSRRSWLDGCISRLGQRLYEQRSASIAQSEAAARAKRSDAPRGNGSDIVLSDVYSSEDDLNYDYHYNKVPGTTARERIERNARWAREREEELRNPTPPVVVVETAKERRQREAEEKKRRARWDRERRIEESKIDRDAYALGQNAGQQIGLDTQVGHGTHNLARLA